jgi:hypothetical protein
MKNKIFIGSLAAILLFLVGVFLEIAFSGRVLWGEIEARTYISSPSGSLGLTLKCPLVLSRNETGTISALILNSLDEEVLPVVTASLSRNTSPKEISGTLMLAPHTSQVMQWQVDASNTVFGRLILVNISQRKYRDLPAREGYCSILFLDLLGMKGRLILILLCSVCLLCIIAGSALWLRLHAPLQEQDNALARPFASLAALATLALIAALWRWWGLIIILDGLALILIVVIFTEVLFNPGPRRQ